MPKSTATPAPEPSPDVRAIVARHDAAAARYDELAARDARTLTPAEFDAFQNAEKTVWDSLADLADAGMLRLATPKGR
ncbi:hypothetical protein [Streptomyces sp. NPDC004376]